MMGARVSILGLAASSESLRRLQAVGAASSAPQDAEAEQAKQQLAVLQEEQDSLKRQLVGLQQAEAGHLKTISEVRS